MFLFSSVLHICYKNIVKWVSETLYFTKVIVFLDEKVWVCMKVKPNVSALSKTALINLNGQINVFANSQKFAKSFLSVYKEVTLD